LANGERQVKESEEAGGLGGLPADRDATDIFNNPDTPAHTSRLIDRMLARERRETDPEKRRRLRHNILHLMKREESQALSVVNWLTDK
jgi:hypothetical protein